MMKKNKKLLTEQRHTVAKMMGKNLRQRRESMGWREKELAYSIGVSRRQLQRWEKGDLLIPAPYLLWLSQRLGVDVGSFYVCPNR